MTRAAQNAYTLETEPRAFVPTHFADGNPRPPRSHHHAYRGQCGVQGAAKAKAAVQSLSLIIERGEVFGLLGPNGAGKTTAIRLMTGFLEPTAGGLALAISSSHGRRRGI